MNAELKYMVLDVDGTLTDGKIYMGDTGECFKAFHVKDGCAIHDILPLLNIKPVIITARRSEIVLKRCKELNIELVFQGIRNKKDKLIELIDSWGLEMDESGVCQEVAYIGDDVIDLSCMKLCGFTACPNDACDEVKEIADYISVKNAGEGAVRDIVDHYRKQQGIQVVKWGKGATEDYKYEQKK